MVNGSQLTNSEIKYKATIRITTCVTVIIARTSTLLIDFFCNVKSTSETLALEVLSTVASQKPQIYIYLSKKKRARIKKKLNNKFFFIKKINKHKLNT